MGAHVTAICSSTRNVDLVRSLGADEVIDYTKTDFVQGRALDVLMDMVGNRAFRTAKAVLKPGPLRAVLGGQRRLGRSLCAHHRRAADVSVRRQALQDVRAGHQRC